MNFNDKGKKFEEAQWKNGELSGKTTMWDNNGVKSIIKSFKEDEKDGLWVWWSPAEIKLKKEVIIRSKTWQVDILLC